MKKIIATTLVLILFGATSFAQKFAYVDSEYILGNIPEYSDAQQQLDDLSVKWQREIEKQFQVIDQLYKQYQADAVLMPEDMKQQKEEEIIRKEKQVKEIQKEKFGQNGELYKKRQELIKPIQEKIFNAIEEIAQKKSFGFVLDKADNVKILFSDPKYDISDEVLENMGYSY
ncbi:MAG: OmpH family outer membrane protein [Bacteroidota bacterium]|nr:OmpH family outer membrane protein [Bacteroidota bacterium]